MRRLSNFLKHTALKDGASIQSQAVWRHVLLTTAPYGSQAWKPWVIHSPPVAFPPCSNFYRACGPLSPKHPMALGIKSSPLMWFTQPSKIQLLLTSSAKSQAQGPWRSPPPDSSGSHCWKKSFLPWELCTGHSVLRLCLASPYSHHSCHSLKPTSSGEPRRTPVLQLGAPIIPCISPICCIYSTARGLLVSYLSWTISSKRGGPHVWFTIISPKSSKVPGTWQE